jgi:hypothetical protein
MVRNTLDTMATFTYLLNTRTREYIIKNDAEILQQVANRNKDLLKRITNFRENNMTETEREEKSVDDILEDIKTNMMTRAFFRKTTTRQNIGEITQIEWIKRTVPDVVKLPADVNGRYLSGGKMHTVLSKVDRPEDATKTFDTYSPSTNTYGVLKVTKQSGGAQDNQYADVKSFVRNMVSYLNANPVATEKFKFYLDGAYYTASKRADLDNMVPVELKTRVIITSCEEDVA